MVLQNYPELGQSGWLGLSHLLVDQVLDLWLLWEGDITLGEAILFGKAIPEVELIAEGCLTTAF